MECVRESGVCGDDAYEKDQDRRAWDLDGGGWESMCGARASQPASTVAARATPARFGGRRSFPSQPHTPHLTTPPHPPPHTHPLHSFVPGASSPLFVSPPLPPRCPPPPSPTQIGSTIIAQSAGVPCIGWNGDGITIDPSDFNKPIPPELYAKANVLTKEDAQACAERVGYVGERREEGRRGEKNLPNLLVLCAVCGVCRGGVRCAAYSYMCDPPPSSPPSSGTR